MRFKFSTTTIQGKGRGKNLGFPTINMEIPPEVLLSLSDGVYGSEIFVKGEKYIGALFFGPIPVFSEKEKSLEVYLINSSNIYVGVGEEVEVEIVKKIRDVQDFSSPDLMVLQIFKDVEEIKNLFY
jgi:riboflavin kinase / FMN adenylyltransferase